MEGKPGSTADKFFSSIGNYITAGISRFVAFLFILISLGAFYGFLVSSRQGDAGVFLLIAPAIAGLIAYYNRAFASAILIVLIIIAFL